MSDNTDMNPGRIACESPDGTVVSSAVPLQFYPDGNYQTYRAAESKFLSEIEWTKPLV